MEANTKGMREEMQEMRGEMRQMGHGLQAGIMALAYDEARTTADKMATPRAATNELRGSAPAGEDRVSRETCGARCVEVTEKVTVTVTKWEKLIRVTETCTRERKEQLRRKARMRYAEIVREQGVKQREGRERLMEKARMTYVRIRERRQKEVETDSHGEKLHGTDGVVEDAHTHTGSEGQ